MILIERTVLEVERVKKTKINPMVSTCDKKCRQKFILDEITEVDVEKDVKKNFFACPYCQTEYIVNYTNLEARDIQRKLQELYKEREAPEANQGKLMSAQRKLQKRLKEILATLKEQYP